MDLKDIFLKKSTREFIAEAQKVPDFGFFELLHGLVYGRWTHFYIALGTGRHPLAKYFAPLAAWFGKMLAKKTRRDPEKYVSMADTYHGKAIPLQTARQLVLVNEEINVPDLEQVIPYKRARALVLKNPDHIVALDCPCRSAQANPCLPLDVCLIIGEPFASFVREHQADKSRWITREQALQILEAEDRRGHVHHAFFKDAMLGRFYALCNCCACCCGALHAHKNGTPMLASSGYVAEIDAENCIACGACQAACQFEAIAAPEGIFVIDYEKCMGCGVCLGQCLQEAIHMKRDEAKGVPLEILALMEKAASS
ncbi:MAG: 4Fe-4S binding protein [Anaerolineales bacterium]|jgi:Pyruvate/2-oxoacid:ferredoxin oxidoreductase delta subunit|nr:4Fe-4S binding protein [Anaerolineales bacterium]